ncbi:GH92 family glycosyl hydrolase [Mucilaginibacter sp. CAU 1740]|uniref:GH92 family glycosyl hydrolase n=1 Tax=Mucilaginibacter sp. CAU 1740 TaxID=3140365 RepID=UPI00325B90FB
MTNLRGGLITLFALSVSAFQAHPQQNEKLTQYVNPFIGTGAVKGSLSGNNYPGATVPFGMVQLSPDTRDEPEWDAASGYDHNDTFIAGFSHTHLSGTGAPDLFDVLLMPYTGDEKTRAGNATQAGSGYGSRFSHANELARAGYYSVKLDDHQIGVELTATEHAGFHKYLFPKNEKARVVIDLNHSLKKPNFGCHVIAAHFDMPDDHTIEGYRVITGWAKLRKIYFYAQFSKPITGNDLVDGGSQYFNQKLINGTDLRAILDFDVADGAPLLTKIGFSTVSTANAKQNLESEIPVWDFDKTVSEADGKWEKELEKIKVDGTPQQKEIFYTALYHTFIQPNNYADVNGDYTAIDYTTHNDPKGFYSTFSLWDTYRAAHPLYTLIQSERDAAFVNSMINQYQVYGYLPIWQLWGQENYCMIGNHAIPVIVDAVLKNLPGIDADKAYEAVKNSSITNHPGSPFTAWEKHGYIPENVQSQSVSLTLEMAYDDWCVAQLAKRLNKTEDYEHFMRRSQYFKNLYDQSTGFFRGKNNDGQWLSPFNPLQYGSNGGNPYTEGNAWQYYWYVPHDIDGLMNLTGGKEKFAAKLDTFFTLNSKPGEVNGNASGFIGQYAHGNEPSHHITYLYNYAGQPWKTQYYVSKVLNELYNTSSSGYAGNEDCGQMSAWYVFSAMGFYPVNPAGGTYAIGSPVLKKASIQLSGGKTFTVLANNSSAKNIYIQSAKLNGKSYSHAYLTQGDISNGGTLELNMGPKPSKKWGL